MSLVSGLCKFVVHLYNWCTSEEPYNLPPESVQYVCLNRVSELHCV